MIRLERAELRCLRLFHVADGIDLDRCEKGPLTVPAEGTAPARRLAFKRQGSQYLQLSYPPLSVDLGQRSLPVAGAAVPVEVDARLYHHGVVAVSVAVPVEPGTTLAALVPVMSELQDSPEVDRLCAAEVDRLEVLVRSTLEDPLRWEQTESYTALVIRAVEGGNDAGAVLADPALARLVLGESSAPVLSDAETQGVLANAWSYTPEDLAVIEWSGAVVLDPLGGEDLMDLLEIANAQLLELRFNDAVLDRQLDRVYEAIEKARSAGLLRSPYAGLLRELTLTIIELSEFIERVENALKIVGDVYLGRVYEGALKALRVHQWTEQVTRKHRLLQQTYGLLKGEVDTRRALTLEAMVVVLILLEIVMALVRVSEG